MVIMATIDVYTTICVKRGTKEKLERNLSRGDTWDGYLGSLDGPMVPSGNEMQVGEMRDIVCAGCSKVLYKKVSSIVDFKNIWCSDCVGEGGKVVLDEGAVVMELRGRLEKMDLTSIRADRILKMLDEIVEKCRMGEVEGKG